MINITSHCDTFRSDIHFFSSLKIKAENIDMNIIVNCKSGGYFVKGEPCKKKQKRQKKLNMVVPVIFLCKVRIIGLLPRQKMTGVSFLAAYMVSIKAVI